MRLQLIVVCMLANGTAYGQDADEPGSGEARSRLLVYDDDDETTVVTTAVDAQVSLPADFAIGAHVLFDVVTTASVDVVSAATDEWDETRTELGARALGAVRDLELSLAFTRSQENDWASNAIAAGVARELFQRNTRVQLGYGLTFNQIGRASDPTFERSLDSHLVNLGVSQLVDPATRVGAAYTLQVLRGFQSSPYRYVLAEDLSRTLESHPEDRLRHAIVLNSARSITRHIAVHGTYRFYADDWGVLAHAVNTRVRLDSGGRWSGGVSARFYVQNEADFYRERYSTTLAYVTADRELASFWDVSGSADVAVDVGPVTIDAKVGGVYYAFSNFAALTSRVALLVGGGVRATW